jgi:hypothetical protein
MKKDLAADLIVTLILMMLFYAGFSKYFDFEGFQRAMRNQPFPSWFSSVLVIILPPVEIIVAFFLARERTRLYGLIATVVLMTAFTIYIIAILLHLFPNVPCSCGGIIRALTWQWHLLFNLFFLSLAIIGLRITIIQNHLKSHVIRD